MCRFTTRAFGVRARTCAQVPLEVPLGLAQRVAAELLEQGLREHQGHHRLGDDPHGRHRRHNPIAPTAPGPVRPSSGPRCAGGAISVEIGFIATPHDQGLPVVMPLRSTGAVGGAGQAGAGSRRCYLRALAPRGLEPEPQLHPCLR